MSNLYKLGLTAGDTMLPELAVPLRNRAGEIVAGLSMVRRGGDRMWQVGALEKQEPLAPGIPGVVHWAQDVGKGLLLLFGTFIVVSALRDERKS